LPEFSALIVLIMCKLHKICKFSNSQSCLDEDSHRMIHDALLTCKQTLTNMLWKWRRQSLSKRV